MIDFKGSHSEHDVILWGVPWYVAYPMSYRQLEEMKWPLRCGPLGPGFKLEDGPF